LDRYALTRDNTRPIELVLDFASLYQETAQVYSTCVAVGAWYRRGSPGPTPPLDGLATCVRGHGEWLVAASGGCWGRCAEADVLTPGARELIMHVTRAVAAEATSLLAVRAPERGVSAPLRFESTFGAPGTARMRATKGYASLKRCASDCQTTSLVAVDNATYCGVGVGGDAVLSVTRPPRIEGVAGSGSSCSSTSDGRPNWLVLAWLMGTAHMALAPYAAGFDGDCVTPDEAVAHWRGLVMHELLHTLSFSGGHFQAAPAPAAEPGAPLPGKSLLALIVVEDADGSTDAVWHFRRGLRAYAAASEHFGCHDPDAWFGVPLMGEPDLGRNSHWETRIMRDDVMSYGHQAVVSFVTLAAMEDLGFYLANYSAAGCMAWGYRQGCEFVTSRCGAYPGTGVDPVTGAEDPRVAWNCGGDPAWKRPDAYLQQKCRYGADPCGSSAYAGGFNGTSCDAQCYTGATPSALVATGRADCARPRNLSLAPGGARPGTRAPAAALGLSLSTWLWGGAALLAALVAIACCCRCCGSCLFPPKGSVAVLVVLSGVIGGGGIALAATATLALGGASQVLALATPALFGYPSLVGAAVAGGAVAGVSLLSLLAVCLRSPRLALVSGVLQALAMALGLLVAAAVIYYAWALGTVGGAWAAAAADGGGRYEGQAGSTLLAQLEGLLCRGYQVCCRDPRLDALLGTTAGAGNATCGAREVDPTDLATVLRDALHPRFCEVIAGSAYGLASVTPP